MRLFPKLSPILLLLFFCTNTLTSTAQKISRIEPPNWWAGMKNPKLQLLVYGNNISNLQPVINHKGVQIEQVIKVQNPNYLFVNLLIQPDTKPGEVKIDFKKDATLVESHPYSLFEREQGASEREGFNSSDVMYLITPDRFANGNPSNDNVAGMSEQLNRSFKGGRHGGDIAGILKNLDYIADLGFTAIWVNPVLENNQPEYSYHGYSTTDFYKVDPRFGTNEEYKALSKAAKEKGIKVIMDMIVNHCGSEHWWMKDIPTSDWVNFPDKYVQTNHLKSTIQDPYVSQHDYKRMVDGWFVKTMPDLNQRNPFMATYLTQNSIWWVEYAGLAGIRMDTYPYPDMDYMTEWTYRVMEEYPHFNIVGEEWNGNPAIVAYWQKGKKNPNGYTSYLRSLMDFPVQEALAQALAADESKENGWRVLYTMIASDFLYAAPEELVVFPDNHDMNRFSVSVNDDPDLYKLGLAFILTTRGVPQLYYGSEIQMTNPGDNDHGIIRSDFPGGWQGDQTNAFTNEGLTTQQIELKEWLTKLLHWRKNAVAIHKGKLMHFAPENSVYVYFRYIDGKKVMVALNKNKESHPLKLERFSEMLDGISQGKNVFTGDSIEIGEVLTLPAKAALILELE